MNDFLNPVYIILKSFLIMRLAVINAASAYKNLTRDLLRKATRTHTHAHTLERGGVGDSFTG